MYRRPQASVALRGVTGVNRRRHKMRSRRSILAATSLAAVIGLGAFAYGADDTSKAPQAQQAAEEKKLDIVETAQGPGMPYTTLVTAIKKAGLVETLKG